MASLKALREQTQLVELFMQDVKSSEVRYSQLLDYSKITEHSIHEQQPEYTIFSLESSQVVEPQSDAITGDLEVFCEYEREKPSFMKARKKWYEHCQLIKYIIRRVARLEGQVDVSRLSFSDTMYSMHTGKVGKTLELIVDG